MANCVENSIDSYNISEASGSSSLGTVNSYGYSVDMSGDWNFKKNINTHISDYDDAFKKAGEKLKIDWRIVAAIAFTESSFRANISTTYKKQTYAGLYAFSEDAWKLYAPQGYKTDFEKRKDPYISSQAFANMFAKNLEAHKNAVSRNDQIALAIQSHHDGSALGTQWATRKLDDKNEKNRKHPESLGYVQKVIGFYKKHCSK